MTTGLAVFHGLVGTVLIALALHSVVNHLTAPSLRRMSATPQQPRMSVLIPARNEAGHIEACVWGWARQAYPDYEVIVYDGESSDDTASRVRTAAGGARHVRVIQGEALPTGWRGKPWACHRLRAQAHGEILVFADADVMPAPDTLLHTAGALAALFADAGMRGEGSVFSARLRSTESVASTAPIPNGRASAGFRRGAAAPQPLGPAGLGEPANHRAVVGNHASGAA